MSLRRCFAVIIMAFAWSAMSLKAADVIPTGAKVFVHSMPDDFDTYLKAALSKKKVPVVLVASVEEADFEIKGTSSTEPASAAKKIVMFNWHSAEQASISVTSRQSGEVVFAYTVNKSSSAHGKQSTAEACAKHIKEEIEKRK